MIEKKDLVEHLAERIRRHIPASILEEAGAPTVEWRPAPIGETPVFVYPDQTEVTFAPDDAVLVRHRHHGWSRIDAIRDGERGIVTGWEREHAYLN